MGLVSKYSTIADTLREEIINGSYSAEGKLPTEHFLADRFQVSRQTIRQAIAGLKAQRFLYQVQGSGTYISKNIRRNSNSSEKKVSVICTYISEYIFPSIISGIETTLFKDGSVMNLFATENKIDKERQILQKIIDGLEVDAIIAEGTKTAFPNPNINLYKSIMGMGIPVIFIHCTYPELEDTVVVGMKDYEGGRIAVQHLIKKGCKKIGGIFKSDDRQGLLRYSGFTDEILKNNVEFNCENVRWYTTEDIIETANNRTEIQTKILAESDIDGIVCYNDKIALAFIHNCEKTGRPIPSVASFDNSYLCKSSVIDFDSLGHRKEALGALAATKIISMINGKKEESELLDWIV